MSKRLTRSRFKHTFRGGPRARPQSRHPMLNTINRRLNKLLKGVEVKYHDMNPITQTPTDTTGVVLNITDLDEGDTAKTRSGEKITAKAFWFKGNITKHASAVSTKIRLFLAMQKNNQIPALNGLLQIGNINSPKNKEYRKLSSIFGERTYIVDANKPMVEFNYYIPKEIQIQYSGAAGTDLGSNSVYLCMISSEAINTPTVAGYSRVTFTDL